MKRFTLVLAFSIVLLAGCNDAANRADNEAAPEIMARTMTASAPKMQAEQLHADATEEKKIIQSGFIRMHVRDAEATHAKVTAMVKASGGYVARENSSNYEQGRRYSMTLRIPQERYGTFVREIETLGSIEQKNIDSRDVTEAHADLSKRIEVSEALEARYVKLLERTHTVKEILQIERELSNIRGEIERMQARMRNMERDIGYSTLTLEFYKRTPASSGSYFYKVQSAFINGWELLLRLFLRMVEFWPLLLLLLGAGMTAAIRIWRAKRKEQRSGN